MLAKSDTDDFEDENDIENQIKVIMGVNHENIVKYFDYFYVKLDDLYHICFIMEYCEVKHSIISHFYKSPFYIIKQIRMAT